MDTVARQQHRPPQPCPRCNSTNTKFCYYNNYSLSQPRYFCKGCRRYWTHGGTLRNVPLGGASRKTKRPKLSTTTIPNHLPPPTTEITVPFYGGGGGFLTSMAGQPVGFGPNTGLFHGLGLPTTGVENQEQQVSFHDLLQPQHESDVVSGSGRGRVPTNGGSATSAEWNFSNVDNNTNRYQSQWSGIQAPTTSLDDP